MFSRQNLSWFSESPDGVLQQHAFVAGVSYQSFNTAGDIEAIPFPGSLELIYTPTENGERLDRIIISNQQLHDYLTGNFLQDKDECFTDYLKRLKAHFRPAFKAEKEVLLKKIESYQKQQNLPADMQVVIRELSIVLQVYSKGLQTGRDILNALRNKKESLIKLHELLFLPFWSSTFGSGVLGSLVKDIIDGKSAGDMASLSSVPKNSYPDFILNHFLVLGNMAVSKVDCMPQQAHALHNTLSAKDDRPEKLESAVASMLARHLDVTDNNYEKFITEMQSSSLLLELGLYRYYYWLNAKFESVKDYLPWTIVNKIESLGEKVEGSSGKVECIAPDLLAYEKYVETLVPDSIQCVFKEFENVAPGMRDDFMLVYKNKNTASDLASYVDSVVFLFACKNSLNLSMEEIESLWVNKTSVAMCSQEKFTSAMNASQVSATKIEPVKVFMLDWFTGQIRADKNNIISIKKGMIDALRDGINEPVWYPKYCKEYGELLERLYGVERNVTDAAANTLKDSIEILESKLLKWYDLIRLYEETMSEIKGYEDEKIIIPKKYNEIIKKTDKAIDGGNHVECQKLFRTQLLPFRDELLKIKAQRKKLNFGPSQINLFENAACKVKDYSKIYLAYQRLRANARLFSQAELEEIENSGEEMLTVASNIVNKKSDIAYANLEGVDSKSYGLLVVKRAHYSNLRRILLDRINDGFKVAALSEDSINLLKNMPSGDYYYNDLAIGLGTLVLGVVGLAVNILGALMAGLSWGLLTFVLAPCFAASVYAITCGISWIKFSLNAVANFQEYKSKAEFHQPSQPVRNVPRSPGLSLSTIVFDPLFDRSPRRKSNQKATSQTLPCSPQNSPREQGSIFDDPKCRQLFVNNMSQAPLPQTNRNKHFERDAKAEARSLQSK